MLKAAGVDQLSIADRLESMASEQIDVFTQKYEAQRSVVLRRVDEVTLCQRYLLQGNYAEDLLETLTGQIPMEAGGLESLGGGPTGPFDHAGLLTEIRDSSPLPATRELAAIALLRNGDYARETLHPVMGALNTEGRVGTEAALALGAWPLHYHDGFFSLGDETSRRMTELAREALGDSQLAPWAAAVVVLPLRYYLSRPWMTDAHAEAAAEMERLGDPLQIGLGDTNFDLSFACALALGTEAVLIEALDSDNEDVVAAAQMVLAREASPRVVSILNDATEDAWRRVMRRLPAPADGGVLSGVLALVPNVGAEFRRTIVGWLKRPAISEYSFEARGAICSWAAQHADMLSVESVTDLMYWAMSAESGSRLVAPNTEAVRGEIVSVLCERLKPLPVAEREDVVRTSAFRLLPYCLHLQPVRELFESWTVAEGSGAGGLLEQISSMDSMSERWEVPGLPTAREVVMQLWKKAGDAMPRLASNIGEHWHWSYSQDREATFELVWQRYKDNPSERVFLRIAFSSLSRTRGKDIFTEAHLRELTDPLTGADAPAFLRALCDSGIGGVYAHLQLVLTEATIADFAPLAPIVYEACQQEESPTQQLPPIVQMARWLTERAPKADKEALEAAVEAFRSGWVRFQQKLAPGDNATDTYYVREKREEIAKMFTVAETALNS